MHKASKVPPLSTGMTPPQSSKHSIRCTRHQRSHHSQLEWLIHNLLNIQSEFELGIRMRIRPRRSHHFANGFPTINQSVFLTDLTTKLQRSHHSVNDFSIINHSNITTYLITALRRSHHSVHGLFAISYSYQILHCFIISTAIVHHSPLDCPLRKKVMIL